MCSIRCFYIERIQSDISVEAFYNFFLAPVWLLSEPLRILNAKLQSSLNTVAYCNKWVPEEKEGTLPADTQMYHAMLMFMCISVITCTFFTIYLHISRLDVTQKLKTCFVLQVQAAALCLMLFCGPLPPPVTCTRLSFMLSGPRRPSRSLGSTRCLIWLLLETRMCA